MSWDEQEVCLQCGFINYEANSSLATKASNEVASQKEPLLV